MSTQHVRYVLCDRNHPDHQNPSIIHDGGPPCVCGEILHRGLKQALRANKLYLKGNPESFIAKVTYERMKV